MSDDLSGRTLGRYQVLERLGRGGMAEVYRAYQPSLDRYVAIKVIYPHLASDPALLERFGREARAVAALRHPNIVQVYDFDVQAGSAFMAMEFVAGPTLKAAIQSLARRHTLLPLPLVARVIGQVADALAYAHDQGLVHRDVKPANVLLRRPGPADAPLDDDALERLLLGLGPADVVLTDFGVARIIKETGEHTAAGTLLGSPAYMSPEQGRGERVDRRSDIYSLGVVLYELLTGQVPFDADTPFAIVLKHTTAALPPPRALRPDLPEALERIVLKALAKDPADRFQDAAALGAAVREQAGPATTLRLEPAPLPADRPPPSAYQTRVFEPTIAPDAGQDGVAKPAAAVVADRGRPAPLAGRGRRRWLFGLLGALAVIAVVTVVAFLAGGAAVFSGLAGAGAIVVPTQYQDEATAIAATIVAEGGTPPSFFATPAPPAASPLPAAVAEAIAAAQAACPDYDCPGGSGQRAVRILDEALAASPGQPDLLAARALAHLRWDRWTYRDEIVADTDAAIAADPASALAHAVRGQFHAIVDEDYAAARADFDRAIELDPGLLLARMARAEFYARAPDYYENGSPSKAQVIADATAALAIDPANLRALDLRADAYYNDDQPDLALADSDAALAIDPTHLNALERRAALYRYEFGDTEAALADYAAAIAAHPDDLELYENRGLLFAELGDYEAALEDADLLVAAEPANPDWHAFRGLAYLALDDPEAAAADFARALQLAGPGYVAARYGRGAAALAADRPDEAIPDLEFAAERADELSSMWYTFYGGRPLVFLDLARAYTLVGSPEEARAALDAALAADDSWALAYLLRARQRREAGDIEGARADLRAALERGPDEEEREAIDAELELLDQ